MADSLTFRLNVSTESLQRDLSQRMEADCLQIGRKLQVSLL